MWLAVEQVNSINVMVLSMSTDMMMALVIFQDLRKIPLTGIVKSLHLMEKIYLNTCKKPAYRLSNWDFMKGNL